MADTYKIGSRLGWEKANALAPGESYTATDDSVWTKNADGSISVLQNGVRKTAEFTYNPMSRQQSPGQAYLQQNIAGMTGGSGYTSPYAEKLQQVISDVQGASWTGWNPDTDESMQAYRKQYLREADRTTEDVLGQYAQNTGGIAGSQAIAAATQAGDYYKAQLADKVPELYENAYSRYLNDVAQKQNLANLLMNAESQAQSQYYQNIDYALTKWASMGYADQEVAGILGVAAGTPTSDQSYSDWSTAFQREQYEYEKEQAAKKAAGGSAVAGAPMEEAEAIDPERVAQAVNFANKMTRSNQPQSIIYNNLVNNGYSYEEIDAAFAKLGW